MSEENENIIDDDSYNDLQELFQRLFVNQIDEKLAEIIKSSDESHKQVLDSMNKIEKKQNCLCSQICYLFKEENRQMDEKVQNIIAGINNLGKADKVIQQAIETLDNVCDRIEENLGEIADKQTVINTRESLSQILQLENKRNAMRFWGLLGTVVGSGIIHMLLFLFS